MRRLCCGQVASIEHRSTTLDRWIKTSHNSKPTNPILADCSLNKPDCQENRRWWGGFLSSKDVSDHNKWIITIPMILPLCFEETRKHKIQKKKCLVDLVWLWLGEQRRRWWWPQQETAKTLHASQTRLGTKEIYKCTKMAIAMVIHWAYILTTRGECKFFSPAFFLAPWPQDDFMLWNSSFYCSWTRLEKVPCHVSLHQSKIFSYEIL